MPRVDSDIFLPVPPEAVWDVLMDFEAYPDWSPVTRRLEGETAQGAELIADVLAEDDTPMVFRPRITVLEPPRLFEWRGRVLGGILMDTRHGFLLEGEGAGTRLTHYEAFSGLYPMVLGARYKQQVERALKAMNEGLKEYLKEQLEEGGD